MSDASLAVANMGFTNKGTTSTKFSTATVVSAYGGDSVSLTVERETRAFDWLNVALEVYGVDGCDELAGSAMTIDALAAVDETGASIEPEWDETVARACGGRLSAAADSWTVDHLLR